MAIDKKVRNQIETFVCMTYDILDETGANTDYWKEKFAKTSDTDFEKMLKQKLPFIFQTNAFSIEPGLEIIRKAADHVGFKLLEKINVPYYHIDENGVPVNTKEALIIYQHLKKVQQVLTKKTSISIDIDKRDNKTGKLLSEDKSSAMSDREIEALAVMGLTATMDEFTTIRADALDAKSQAYNIIANTGSLSKEDYDVLHTDSVARKTISAYMLAGHIESNLILEDGYTPYTLSNANRKVVREE